jgi:hypothetical protein
VRAALREIGTSYVGKEPLEHVVDVLRVVTTRSGSPLGFEACLTSRPFTIGRPTGDQLGAFAFGRSDGVAADLEDGLDVLATQGWTVRVGVDGDIVVLGPVSVPDRLVPTALRLVAPHVARYLVVDEFLGDELVCMDPVFGGLVVVPVDCHESVAASPPRLVDPAAVAAECLRRGSAARLRLGGQAERDAAFLWDLAGSAAELCIGPAGLRFRDALAGLQVHNLRWVSAIAAWGGCRAGDLALVDALHDQVGVAGDTLAAAVAGDVNGISRGLDRLAEFAQLVTKLLEAGAGVP